MQNSCQCKEMALNHVSSTFHLLRFYSSFAEDKGKIIDDFYFLVLFKNFIFKKQF
jgi:hypothetical protein